MQLHLTAAAVGSAQFEESVVRLPQVKRHVGPIGVESRGEDSWRRPVRH